MNAELKRYRKLLDCGFAEVERIFPDCLASARARLSEAGVARYVAAAGEIGGMGRGAEPAVLFLELMPAITAAIGEGAIGETAATVRRLADSANGRAIAPLLQSLPAAAERLETPEQFGRYLDLVVELAARTTPSTHGIQTMHPSPCAVEFLENAPRLLTQLPLEGVRRWVEHGLRHHGRNPEQLRDYFLLQSPDSRAVVQRERHGTLFADVQRRLDLYLRGLWRVESAFVPYSLAFDVLRAPRPYLDSRGVHLPDVYDDDRGVRGVDRYRALLAHLMAHRRWTTPIYADNLSPFQQLAVETFEDARVEALAMRRYPGLRELWKRLHPIPREEACPEGHSRVRHRLAMLSRALLDPDHDYRDPTLRDYVDRFCRLMAAGETATPSVVPLAVEYFRDTREPSDASPEIWFEDTEVDYRDDNRYMWKFHEPGDEDDFISEHGDINPAAERPEGGVSPHLYPEWDSESGLDKPDWVSLYEHLAPGGDAAVVDALFDRHAGLVKQLARVIDMLKPQQKVRVRFREEGTDLDLDVAIRALIDFRSGAMPDPRIHMSHRSDGRNIAVTLLLDLSTSINEIPEGGEKSILELSREAVTLLAWTVDRMGDPFAVGGFHSNTRHEVRYLHFKRFDEPWGSAVKGRIAAMEAGLSTRMGAALRHAGRILAERPSDKRLLLVLSDGKPHDIDVADDRALIGDARRAVRELSREGIHTYCITLDTRADDYVADIFGDHGYTVVDRIEKLPERLPQLFMALTG